MNDFRFAFRQFLKAPAFAAFAILTLGLGIGASTAMFSVVEGVMLRPLPVAEPERLVRIYESYLERPGWLGSVSVANFRDWAERSRSFAGLALAQGASFALLGRETPERLRGELVSANFFAVTGGKPLLGRTFAPDEDQPGRDGVVILSEDTWRQRFRADPGVVGTRVTLDGIGVTVVGVMPARFRLPHDSVEVWRPLVPGAAVLNERGAHSFEALGRLKPEVTLDAARREMAAIAADLAREFPDHQSGRSVTLFPLLESLTRHVRSGLTLLSAAALGVLVIAAANVAGLLVARAAARHRELAVRAALGASRGRILRQLLAESSVLAAGAAVAGVLLAHLGVDGFVALAGDALPRAHEVHVNALALGFAILAGAAVGVGCGLLPAWSTLRGGDPAGGLQSRGAAGSRGRARLRALLVGGEIALALVLLCGGGLLFRSLRQVLATPAGVRIENLLTARLSLPPERYPDAASLAAFYGKLGDRLAAVPGAAAVGGINILPIDDWGSNGNFTIEGRPPFPKGAEPLSERRAVFGAYYQAMGMQLVAGRWLDGRDAAGAPLALLINETMARRFWDSPSAAIGARLGGISQPGELWTVVGVFADVRQSGLDRAPELEMHFTAAQSPHAVSPGVSWAQTMTLVAQPAPGMPARSLAAPLARALREVDGGLPLYRVLPIEAILDEFSAARRLNLRLLGGFALAALALAAVGLYGVMSYLVTQREREFGVRLALGAEGSDLLRLVLRQGLWLGAGGAAVGIATALGLGRFLESMLFGVKAWDPLVLSLVLGALGLVVLLASLLPAWRASRVQPVVALRAE